MLPSLTRDAWLGVEMLQCTVAVYHGTKYLKDVKDANKYLLTETYILLPEYSVPVIEVIVIVTCVQLLIVVYL